MFDIDFEKFKEFYLLKIKPVLADLEREREKIIAEFKRARVIFSLPVFVCAICFGILFLIIPHLPDNVSEKLIMLGCAAGPCTLIYAVYKQNVAFEKKEKFIAKLKRRVYIRLFKSLNLHYNISVSPEVYEYQKILMKYVKLKDVHMVFDDSISGIYKDIPFELVDASIKGKYTGNDTTPTETGIMSGLLLLAVKLNKPVKDETIIKSDNFKIFKIKKNIIKLEDNDFNKRFKVLSDNEVEARYIITPSFMERLQNFHKRRKDKTIIFFDDSCSESKNMFILTNTGKDNFEIPFNKSILNEKCYYNLLKELTDMLEIAVALKLERNTVL